MGQALYRKYRSKSLSEIVGQEHITDTLSQALKSGRISHAYLFTGPRGVGKTSIARILAHEINNLPYDEESQHIDIIEIDAASNRGIEDARELRERVYIAPTSAKYKVYIIDEVHMLTTPAFNALLKTLEEPPAHVVFILATTDAHKLPETIISRTQRYTFKPVEKTKVVAHLKEIAKSEGIKVSDAALELLAEHGDGSFRDSISMLDQASNQGKDLEANDVHNLLGIPPAEAVLKLTDLIATNQSPSDVMSQLGAIYDQGYQAVAVAKQMASQLRAQIVSGNPAIGQTELLALLEELIEVPVAHNPERFLEIILLKTLRFTNVQPTPKIKPLASAEIHIEMTNKDAANEVEPSLPPKPAVTNEEPPAFRHSELVSESLDTTTEDIVLDVQPQAVKAAVKSGVVQAISEVFDEAIWPHILGALKQKYNTLYGVVRMAQPKFTNDSLELAFSFAFHQKRVNDAKNRQLISSVIEELCGQNVTITCVVDKAASPPKIAVVTTKANLTSKNSSNLSTISNIFGGGELLNS